MNQTDHHPKFVLTIDGPAASGKSSVSRELARRFGWSWVSTGAFYRGLAYIAHHYQTDLTDEVSLVKLVKTAPWKVELRPDQTYVYLENRDVTAEVAREFVGSLASKVSSLPRVRSALLDAQRQCGKDASGLIAEGRDCGTVVFPHAQVKIFLTGRAEDRAARRARDEGAEISQLIDEQKLRDSQDASRKAAPMQASKDSITIDTSDLTLPEVVDRIETIVRQHPSFNG